MIRCNNCMRVFQDESELSKILEITGNKTGEPLQTLDRIIYDPYADLPSAEDADVDNINYEIFNGCSECMADEYLMDLESEVL